MNVATKNTLKRQIEFIFHQHKNKLHVTNGDDNENRRRTEEEEEEEETFFCLKMSKIFHSNKSSKIWFYILNFSFYVMVEIAKSKTCMRWWSPLHIGSVCVCVCSCLSTSAGSKCTSVYVVPKMLAVFHSIFQSLIICLWGLSPSKPVSHLCVNTEHWTHPKNGLISICPTMKTCNSTLINVNSGFFGSR